MRRNSVCVEPAASGRNQKSIPEPPKFVSVKDRVIAEDRQIFG